jgi:hypothetical protein
MNFKGEWSSSSSSPVPLAHIFEFASWLMYYLETFQCFPTSTGTGGATLYPGWATIAKPLRTGWRRGQTIGNCRLRELPWNPKIIYRGTPRPAIPRRPHPMDAHHSLPSSPTGTWHPLLSLVTLLRTAMACYPRCDAFGMMISHVGVDERALWARDGCGFGGRGESLVDSGCWCSGAAFRRSVCGMWGRRGMWGF